MDLKTKKLERADYQTTSEYNATFKNVFNFSTTFNKHIASEAWSKLNNSFNISLLKVVSNKPKNSPSSLWKQGLINFKSFITIMKYFRWSMILPCSLSIFSAGLIVLVMGRNSFRLAGKKLVIALNLTEGIKCFAFVFNRSWKAYINEQVLTFSSSYFVYFSSVIMWLPDTLARSGILLNCSITIERFFILAYPVRFHKKRLIKHDTILIITIALSMMLFQMNPIILFHVTAKPYLNYTQTFLSDELVSTLANVNPSHFKLYISLQVAGAVMFRVIPVLVTIIFNTMTVISLYRHSKQRLTLVANSGQVPSGRSTVSQTNRMLLVSSFVFAFMAALKPTNRALRLVIPTYGEGKENSPIYMILNDVFLLIDNMVPLVNLVIYRRLSSEFRECLKAMCPCIKYISNMERTPIRHDQREEIALPCSTITT